MKKSKYEKLEGKVVDYTYCGDTIPARVIGIDPDIGITLVSDAEPTENLLCATGPLSPLWRKHFSKQQYKESFKLLYKQIKSGRIDTSKVDQGARQGCDYVSPDDCSFNQ